MRWSAHAFCVTAGPADIKNTWVQVMDWHTLLCLKRQAAKQDPVAMVSHVLARCFLSSLSTCLLIELPGIWSVFSQIQTRYFHTLSVRDKPEITHKPRTRRAGRMWLIWWYFCAADGWMHRRCAVYYSYMWHLFMIRVDTSFECLPGLWWHWWWLLQMIWGCCCFCFCLYILFFQVYF